MKLNKKKVLVIALAVCLIATLSMGTLAWFTDTDSSVNDFFVTNSDKTDPEAIFSVEVRENVAGGTANSVNGYTFTHITPNQTIEKAPYVVNTGVYDQYVRATVTISDYAAFVTALGADYRMEDVFLGINPAWEFDHKVVDTTADTVSYVFYLNRVLTVDDTAVLFTKVVIPYQLEKEDFINTTLSNGFEISVFAEAIQSANTGDNAKDAFALIDNP